MLSVFSLFLITENVIPFQAASYLPHRPEEKILSNGLSMIYHEGTSSEVSVLQIVIKGGKRADPIGKEGLAYLTTRLTLEIPDQGIVRDLMSQATRIAMNCFSDYSVVTVACLSENLEETVELISQLMKKPLFSSIRIDNIKKMMNRLREREEDDSITKAHIVCLQNFFNGTSYGDSVLGSEESIKSIKKKDIQDFYDIFFVSGNISAVISSDLDKERALTIIEEHFSDFSSGKAPEPSDLNIPALEENELIISKDSQQALVSISYALPETSRKSYILSSLADHLLGKGLNSRLWPLRTEAKLAYSVNSQTTHMKECGLIEAYLETDVDKTTKAVSALGDVLQDLYRNGITEEEFSVTKTYFKATFLRDNETKQARTQTLAQFEALDLGIDFFERLFLDINDITLEEFNAFLKDILDPQKALKITIGPV
jgi:predicted Zn-dependent peptidase